MATQILAVGTGAGTSSNVTVTAGTPVVVGLFQAATATPIPYFGESVLCDLQDPNGNWVQQSPVLNAQNPSIVLIGPGVYRFRRPATSVSVGVMTG